MGRLRDGALSNSPRAVARRAKYVKKGDSSGSGTSGEEGGAPGAAEDLKESTPDRASIGVVADEPEPVVASVAQYHCTNCLSEVSLRMAECPRCGASLRWGDMNLDNS